MSIDREFLRDKIIKGANLPPDKETTGGFFSKRQMEVLALYIDKTNNELKKMREALGNQNEKN